MHGEMSDAELLRGLPRDLAQDIKRAAYEAKVAEMEDAARRRPAYRCECGAYTSPTFAKGPCSTCATNALTRKER